MLTPDALRRSRIALHHGTGAIPVAGFGTLIPDPVQTVDATKTALEVGFRHLDCAERYRNEDAVGDALLQSFTAGVVERADVFVTTKLWNTNHRPERVGPALKASLGRLRLDYIDCYLIHTPFAFAPGDDQDPRDERGQVIYDDGVTLGGHLARVGAPCRRRPLPIDRTVQRIAASVARHRRGCGSSPPSCRSSPTRICRNGSCSTTASNRGSFCKPLQRWDIR